MVDEKAGIIRLGVIKAFDGGEKEKIGDCERLFLTSEYFTYVFLSLPVSLLNVTNVRLFSPPY